jgi:hypothetical protein
VANAAGGNVRRILVVMNGIARAFFPSRLVGRRWRETLDERFDPRTIIARLNAKVDPSPK